MAQSDYLSMTPADVIYSADYLDHIGVQASAERRALATELAGHGTAWQEGARPGFVAFIETVQRQSERLHTDITDVGAKLRTAVHAYVATAHESAEMLRYHHSGPSAL
jgi:hypothetical protein